MFNASHLQDKTIILGKGYKFDANVVVGYKPSRKIENLQTVIGENANLRSNTTIYAGVKIGNNLETGHNVVIREENIIGDNFNIWNNSVMDYGCNIGNNVKIHSNVYIAQFTVIEDDVFIAPGVTFANDFHPGCDFSKKCMKGPYIKKGAQIGVNVTLLPYVAIGEYSLIGAGSVVVDDIPPQSVVVGNPGRVIKTIEELVCSTGITDKPYKGRQNV